MRVQASRGRIPGVVAQRTVMPVRHRHGFGDGPFGIIPFGGQDRGPYGPDAERVQMASPVAATRERRAAVFATRVRKGH